jgi:plasmid stability protein
MRTSLDLPDPLFRHLKARAALEGRSLRELVVSLLERGLAAPAPLQADEGTMPSSAPSVRLGAPMALAAAQLSNAALSELLDG